MAEDSASASRSAYCKMRGPMCQRCDDLRNKIQKFQYFVDQFDLETTQRLKAGIDELEAERASLHREEEVSYAD
jgi:hypothetical protein